MSADSRVVVEIITDTSAAPVKTGEGRLYVMYDAADLDEAGNLPDLT
jgi:hypothetical protein